MKIIGNDFEKGSITLVITNAVDLIYLEKIIEPGDLVTAKTFRNVFVQSGDRKIKTGKKIVFLTLEVKKVEIQKQTKKLKVIGKIVKAPEEFEMGYHTIEVEVGSRLRIEKKWKEEQIKFIEKSKMPVEKDKIRVIQEFLIHVGRNDGLAVYGKEQIYFAIDTGAVKTLLISEEKIWDEEFINLVERVFYKGGNFLIVSEKTEIGKIFCRTYGLGAILRFSVF